MAEKPKLDIIIFGATGFTGKCVLIEFIKLNRRRYSWAVAGRNHEKLKELLEWATVKSGEDVSKTMIIVADCSDEESLNSMASQGKVVINCCGPYRFYGEPVVKACVERGTHHLDVSGEPEYMESIQLKYHEPAEAKHVYIVSACGFDSVPADFGVIHFVKNFEGVVNSIESHMMMEGSQSSNEPSLNIGTWKSAIFSIENRNNLPHLRKKLSQLNRPKLEPRLKPSRSWGWHYYTSDDERGTFSEQIRSIGVLKWAKYMGRTPMERICSENVPHSSSLYYTNMAMFKQIQLIILNISNTQWPVHRSQVFDQKLGIPFPGSDKSVVYRTQDLLYKEFGQRPVQYYPYVIVNSFTTLLKLALMGFFLVVLGNFGWGQRLLIRYTEFFTLGAISRTGPSEQARMSRTTIFRFRGDGWTKDIADSFQQKEKINVPTNKEMITEISLVDAGYGFTAIAVILGAFTVLNENENMPSVGGVYTPGGAFSKTSYLKQLEENGFSFKILESSSK